MSPWKQGDTPPRVWRKDSLLLAVAEEKLYQYDESLDCGIWTKVEDERAGELLIQQAKEILDSALAEISKLGVEVAGTYDGYTGNNLNTSADAAFATKSEGL
jgi:hypothetical protein